MANAAARSAKTIGILTSGGDCAGLNAAIRAVVSRAVQGYGWRVLGIHQGTMGLLRRPLGFEELDLRIATVNILRLGGTILGTTNKGNPFAFPMPDGSLKDRSAEVIAGVRELDLDALIGVGGDGSFAILRQLAQQGGLNLIGIPYTMEAVAAHIEKVRRQGRNFALVVVAEAVKDLTGQHVQRQHSTGGATYGGIGNALGDALARLTGAETRVSILGHVQRGSQPTWSDRLIASAFGVHAVDLIAAGKFDRMVAWQNRRVVDVPLAEAIAAPQQVDPDSTLVRTARGLGICLGDG